MADFTPAYDKMMLDEGGYVLHTVKGDTGGQTYAGISRRANPGWSGWKTIDRGDVPAAQQVYEFYLANYWQPLKLDAVPNQDVASSIFNFGVNAGIKTAGKLAQIVVGVTPDGVFGPQTLAALTMTDPALFIPRYALAKITRYAEICNRNRSQSKFLLGWINRTLKGLT